MTVTTNQHEIRRRATRDALRETALSMFAEAGFDNVTVAEVADAVGVTERTFYRHFPTKEAVLFQDYQYRLEWLSSALALRPVDESVFDSVLVAVQSFPHDIEIVRQAAILRNSIISGERVADHLRIVQMSFAAVLSDFVRQRHADHPDVVLLAATSGNVLAAALVSAVEVWGVSGCTDDVAALVGRSLEYLRSGLSALG
ncbi:MAG TPA: TetR family transcriptional regulator [Mycobacteriales bacterium]|nr:TetR family transcriptional regulator [Mycobacteriales bacterium]